MSLLRYTIAICMYSGIFGGVKPYPVEEEYCVAPGVFKCSNNRCLSDWFVCDGEDDCGDNSDEINCLDKVNVTEDAICARDQFQCSDKTCISLNNFCDRRDDCPDKSDEYDGCTNHKICTAFRCKNGYCVENQRVCDSFDDCADLSDEINCGNQAVLAEECNNRMNRFLCDNGRCIVLNATCNSNDDCGDYSDENETECKNAAELCKIKNICSHHCQKTPKGPTCSCPPGHSLVNNTTCKDINECTENAKMCDQRCVNEAGSYYCTCELGYFLQDDGRTCKAEGGEALMIFSVDQGILGLYLESRVNFTMIDNLPRPGAISMDANYVYWSDMKIGDKTIMRRHEDGDPKIIATAGVGLPEEMALDWLTGNVYFIDNFWKHVAVCKNDGTYCTIILCEPTIDSPTGLVLHPIDGEMFWSECGAVPRISRAGMNGEDVGSLVTEVLGCPTNLAIDYPDERLFFVDSKRETVESVRLLDGTDRRQVLQATGNALHSIAIFETKLYWSDRRRRTIESADKRDGSDSAVLIEERRRIGEIHIYHTALQPTTSNRCENSSCSQLCLLARNRTYSCACKPDDLLGSDGHTCIPVRKAAQLTIAFGNTLMSYRHEVLGKPRINATSGWRRVKHVAYDPKTESLIANDEFSDRFIRLEQRDDETDQAIGYTSSQHLNGMDFDYYTNNIYSSNSALRCIEILSVETGEMIFREFHDEPKDILVVPKYATMFVVFKSDDERYRIDQMRMGRPEGQPNHVVAGLRGPKISLAWDPVTKRVFFSDEATGSIRSFNVKGEDRRLVRAGLEGPVSLAVMDRRIFWTLRNSTKLQWVDERDRYLSKKEVLLPIPIEELVEIMDLVKVGDGYDEYEHACRLNNGGCSHVCLVTPGDADSTLAPGGTCDCPTGMVLDADNRTCILSIPNGVGEWRKCTRCALC